MFTPGERLILVNQFRLLELLDKDEGDRRRYREMQEILERGYTLNYGEVTENLDKEVPETTCTEVMDILNMYRVLKGSYDTLSDKSGIEAEELKFPGFDGNNESEYLRYAEFLTEQQGRWEELKDEVKNSHAQTLSRYRKMLRKLRGYERPHDPYGLKRDQIIDILS